MSQPFSRYLHPFDSAHHPAPEPEVERAILASLMTTDGEADRASAMGRDGMARGPASREPGRRRTLQ